MEAPRSPNSKSHWPVTVLVGSATGMPAAVGVPKSANWASLRRPARTWMELTNISRRSSWSPSPKRMAVGPMARRGASRPWLAVQSSCLMPSTYFTTTGGLAAMS